MTDVRTVQPLFFASGLSVGQIARFVTGIEEALEIDPVEFTGDAGGDATRELGVPFLAGMDEIDVSEASFYVNVSAATDPRDVTVNATEARDGNGVFVSLPSPGRLVKVAISYDPPKSPPATARVVVRSATPGAGGFTPGPPLFADPDFPAPGTMFGPVLSGLSTTAIEAGGQMLTMPPTMGSAWLIQIATGSDGDGAAKLSPLAIVPQVTAVQVDALPNNFKVTLGADGGDVTLWSRPGLFLRGGAPQLVSFLPMARKHLTGQLKKVGAAALTVPLKFHSDSASRVEVTAKQLTVTYRVKPLSEGAAKPRLGGSWVPVTLNAPAGLTALAGSVDLTATLQPRALNGGSPEPPLGPSGEGQRLTASSIVATAMPFDPLAGTSKGTLLPLASARVLVETVSDSEVVLEIRGDAAGIPGPVLAGPEVKQVKKGTADWLEFELKRPLPVSSGGAPVWVALRLNRGELRWFADPALTNPTRRSTDKGQTWSEPEAPLTRVGGPLAQLFHVLAEPLPAPVIRVRYRDQILANDLGQGATRKGPREFAASGVALPAALLAALAKRTGSDRVDTVIHLFSRSALDLTLGNASISYDPFGAGVTKGS